MHARIARYSIEPDRCDEAVDSFRTAGEELAKLDGFAGGYVLVDRHDGEIVSVTLWQSGAALETSESKAGALRRQAVGAVEGEVLSVGAYDVALDLGSVAAAT
jgi:heme-degrading monooxygenase HmoA